MTNCNCAYIIVNIRYPNPHPDRHRRCRLLNPARRVSHRVLAQDLKVFLTKDISAPVRMSRAYKTYLHVRKAAVPGRVVAAAPTLGSS
jgi:hypothetical protein